LRTYRIAQTQVRRYRLHIPMGQVIKRAAEGFLSSVAYTRSFQHPFEPAPTVALHTTKDFQQPTTRTIIFCTSSSGPHARTLADRSYIYPSVHLLTTSACTHHSITCTLLLLFLLLYYFTCFFWLQ
jgi:hypothetical protein